MKRALEYLAVLLVVVLIAVTLLPSLSNRSVEPPISAVDSEMKNFLLAMQSYEGQYGRYPSGETGKILLALLGDNPRKTTFLVLATKSTNFSGQFVDPWGTPFQIALEPNLAIRSAGPNKAFGDNDDIVQENAASTRTNP